MDVLLDVYTAITTIVTIKNYLVVVAFDITPSNLQRSLPRYLPNSPLPTDSTSEKRTRTWHLQAVRIAIQKLNYIIRWKSPS